MFNWLVEVIEDGVGIGGGAADVGEGDTGMALDGTDQGLLAGIIGLAGDLTADTVADVAK